MVTLEEVYQRLLALELSTSAKFDLVNHEIEGAVTYTKLIKQALYNSGIEKGISDLLTSQEHLRQDLNTFKNVVGTYNDTIEDTTICGRLRGAVDLAVTLFETKIGTRDVVVDGETVYDNIHDLRRDICGVLTQIGTTDDVVYEDTVFGKINNLVGRVDEIRNTDIPNIDTNISNIKTLLGISDDPGEESDQNIMSRVGQLEDTLSTATASIEANSSDISANNEVFNNTIDTLLRDSNENSSLATKLENRANNIWYAIAAYNSPDEISINHEDFLLLPNAKWNTDQLKALHINDLLCFGSLWEDEDPGYSLYRWEVSGQNYIWVPLGISGSNVQNIYLFKTAPTITTNLTSATDTAYNADTNTYTYTYKYSANKPITITCGTLAPGASLATGTTQSPNTISDIACGKQTPIEFKAKRGATESLLTIIIYIGADLFYAVSAADNVTDLASFSDHKTAFSTSSTTVSEQHISIGTGSKKYLYILIPKVLFGENAENIAWQLSINSNKNYFGIGGMSVFYTNDNYVLYRSDELQDVSTTIYFKA